MTGARIAHDTTDLTEEDVGTLTDLFEIKKIGDEYFAFVTSEKTTAVTVVIRGPSKDIMNEVERNIQDAVNCVRNVLLNPRVVPGAGALEMALAHVSCVENRSPPKKSWFSKWAKVRLSWSLIERNNAGSAINLV